MYYDDRPFSAPTGRDSIAQGEALGWLEETTRAPTGRDSIEQPHGDARAQSRPFRASLFSHRYRRAAPWASEFRPVGADRLRSPNQHATYARTAIDIEGGGRQAQPNRLAFGPSGAAVCRHGWSVAQPVDEVVSPDPLPRRGRGFVGVSECRRESFAPPGRGRMNEDLSPRVPRRRGCAPSLLHPWRQSFAPPGR